MNCFYSINNKVLESVTDILLALLHYLYTFFIVYKFLNTVSDIVIMNKKNILYKNYKLHKKIIITITIYKHLQPIIVN